MDLWKQRDLSTSDSWHTLCLLWAPCVTSYSRKKLGFMYKNMVYCQHISHPNKHGRVQCAVRLVGGYFCWRVYHESRTTCHIPHLQMRRYIHCKVNMQLYSTVCEAVPPLQGKRATVYCFVCSTMSGLPNLLSYNNNQLGYRHSLLDIISIITVNYAKRTQRTRAYMYLLIRGVVTNREWSGSLLVSQKRK